MVKQLNGSVSREPDGHRLFVHVVIRRRVIILVHCKPGRTSDWDVVGRTMIPLSQRISPAERTKRVIAFCDQHDFASEAVFAVIRRLLP